MNGLRYDKTQILETIDKMVKRTMRMDMTWDWPCGVAYYGIGRAFEVTGKEEYMTYLRERIDEYLELGLPQSWTVNKCAMGHCLITLYTATGDRRYRELIMSKVSYLRNSAPRFGDGVLQHTVSSADDFPEQCWADTLFMAAYFLLRTGVMEEDEELIEDALNQYYHHIHYLQNMDNGLWYHGYDHLAGNHMSGFHWGRANAWAAYTMSQVSQTLPASYLYPKYLDVAGSLNEQLAALKLLQTTGGLWRTILDDPGSDEEVSASCGIAAAFVLKANPLHIKYMNQAIDGVLNEVSEDGRVRHVSGGTAVMKDREGYQNISRDWIQGWGQGLALAFFAAVIDSEKRVCGGAL